jgi:hypothetical protein
VAGTGRFGAVWSCGLVRMNLRFGMAPEVTDYRWSYRLTTAMKVVDTLWIEIVEGHARMEEIAPEVVGVEES